MSIFVSIASYRDTLITETINSLFFNAFNKKRIFVGVLLQILDETIEPNEYSSNIRTMRINYTEAKGPLYARQIIINKLYKKEDFYLQIDSHTKFYPNWDVKILDNLFFIHDFRNAIITCYPVAYDQYQKQEHVPQMVIKKDYVKNTKIKMFKALLKKTSVKPIETPYLGAGFLFGLSSSIIPHYPKIQLPYLFQGEEMLLYCTFKKQGFKFYSPTENIVAHLYYRKDFPKLWKDTTNWHENELIALKNLEEYLERNDIINI